MGCTWAVAGFQVVSACAHTLHVWRRQMHSSPQLCWAKQNDDIINSTPEDVWDLWIKLVAGPNISLLVGSCSSVLLCCTSVPAKGLTSRPGGSPPVYTPSYWLDEIEWSPILLHAHCLGSRRWTRPPAAVFHRHAGGSGEKFGSSAPPISSAPISEPLLGYTTPSLVDRHSWNAPSSSFLLYLCSVLLFSPAPNRTNQLCKVSSKHTSSLLCVLLFKSWALFFVLTLTWSQWSLIVWDDFLLCWRFWWFFFRPVPSCRSSRRCRASYNCAP